MSVSIRAVKAIPPLELGLVLLALLSVAILLVPVELLETRLEITPSEYSALLVDDSYAEGGSSARWLNQSQQQWQCELGEGFETPFCSLQLTVTDEQGAGLDLSRFDT